MGSIRALNEGGGENREEMRSYRPRSLVPVVGKVLEKLILSRLNSTHTERRSESCVVLVWVPYKDDGIYCAKQTKALCVSNRL